MKYQKEYLTKLHHHDAGEVVKCCGAWDNELEEFDADIHFEVVVNAENNTDRWYQYYDLVFFDFSTSKCYHVQYRKGLTEYQYVDLFHTDDDGLVECQEVEISTKEVITVETTWKPV